MCEDDTSIVMIIVSNPTASSALINNWSHLSADDKYSKIIQDVHHTLCHLLMGLTGLPNDICEQILSYLTNQYQLITFNPFTIDSMYSITQFILLMVNNICHFALIALLLSYYETMTMVPAIICLIISSVETFFILYSYKQNYKISIRNDLYSKDLDPIRKIKEILAYKTVLFTNKLDSTLQICIYIPFTIVVLFVFDTNYVVYMIYFSSYLIITLYECYMYHRQNILYDLANRKTTRICTLIYLQINALILMIYSFIYSLLPIFIVSLVIIYGLIHLFFFLGIFETNWITKNKISSIINLVFIFVESICFAIFSWQLFNENNNNTKTIKIASIIFTIINILIIHTFYYFVGQSTDLKGTSYGALVDKAKFYKKLNLWNDILVHLPMIIILLYFYYSINVPSYFVSWYLCVVIMVLRECYRIISAHCIDNFDIDQVLITQLIMVLIKFGIVMFVFGIVYIDYGGLSIFFVVLGCLIWSFFCCFCFSFVCCFKIDRGVIA